MNKAFKFDTVTNHIHLGSVLILSLMIFGCSGSNDTANNANSNNAYYPNNSWEHVQNLEKGWDINRLEEARNFAGTLNMAAAVIVHQGRIVQQWGEVDRKIGSHSIRKSILIEMFGPAVERGIINLSATMNDLNIDDIPPELSIEEKEATVKMLMKARSGIYHDAAYETAAMKAARPQRHSHKPGTFWYYNNWDFNVLGHIYRELVGKDIFEAFNEEIAIPIGIKDFNPETDGNYVYEEAASKYPAYPFKISAMQLARFGLLMERDGKWKDKQIIPKYWVKETTAAYSDAGNAGGYGYLWWISVEGKHFNNIEMPFGLYTARGARGHVLAVIPDYELVFVYRNDDAKSGSTSYDEIGQLLHIILKAMK